MHLVASKEATDTHPTPATATPAGMGYWPQLLVPSALPEVAFPSNVFAGVFIMVAS